MQTRNELISWSESQCRDGWLHRYQIIDEDYNGVLEVCIICGLHKVFKMIGGKTDNMSYLKSHLRQALTRDNTIYDREYNGIQK